MGEDGFCEAENVLSRDCIFLFRKNQQSGGEQNQIIGGEGQNQQPIAEGIDLLESESTRRWKDVVDNYLVRELIIIKQIIIVLINIGLQLVRLFLPFK